MVRKGEDGCGRGGVIGRGEVDGSGGGGVGKVAFTHHGSKPEKNKCTGSGTTKVLKY